MNFCKFFRQIYGKSACDWTENDWLNIWKRDVIRVLTSEDNVVYYTSEKPRLSWVPSVKLARMYICTETWEVSNCAVLFAKPVGLRQYFPENVANVGI